MSDRTGRARVAVVGAGPAGGACAISLARRGVDATLYDARAFPRTKVCGEFVSPAATRILESLLAPERLESLGARRVRRFHLDALRAGRERTISWDLPHPGWALSRGTLDAALADEACALGVNVRLATRIAGVVYGRDRVLVRAAARAGGPGDTGEFDAVVHADGTGRLDGAPTPNRAGVLAHKCHFVPDRPIEGLRMRACAGAYVGTIQVEGGLATCALVAERGLIGRAGGDADGMLRRLWPGFDPAWRRGPWLACGVPGVGFLAGLAGRGFTPPCHARSLRIGNAAGAVEPVGGEGIGLALWAGVLAGRTLPAPAGLDDGAMAAWRVAVARPYRARLRGRRPVCRLIGEAMMRPRLVSGLWGVLSRPSLAIEPLYRLSGKPA